MEEPKYHLSGVMRGRDEVSGDFDGPLAVDADGTVEGNHLNDIGSVRAGRVFAEAIREALGIPPRPFGDRANSLA